VPLASQPVVTTITDTEVTKTSESITINFNFPLDFKEQTERYEMELIQQALSASQYNQKKTAEILGLSYHQLRGILKKYNLLDKA